MYWCTISLRKKKCVKLVNHIADFLLCHFECNMHKDGQWTDWSWDSFPIGQQPNKPKLVKWTRMIHQEEQTVQTVPRKQSTLSITWQEPVPSLKTAKSTKKDLQTYVSADWGQTGSALTLLLTLPTALKHNAAVLREKATLFMLLLVCADPWRICASLKGCRSRKQS